MNLARKPIARGVVVETVSPTELLQVLNGACSLDQAQIMASGDRLKQMLDMFGIFDSLQDVAAQRELPLPIRQQAIIQFTRAAPNHWKSRKWTSPLWTAFRPYKMIDSFLMIRGFAFGAVLWSFWMRRMTRSAHVTIFLPSLTKENRSPTSINSPCPKLPVTTTQIIGEPFEDTVGFLMNLLTGPPFWMICSM